jgi:predicted ATPase
MLVRSTDHNREQEQQAMIQKREDLLIWLSAFEYQKSHNDVCARRLQDTGQWLLQKKEFQSWRDDQQSNNTLWCYGIPGAGKTILSYVGLREM